MGGEEEKLPRLQVLLAAWGHLGCWTPVTFFMVYSEIAVRMQEVSFAFLVHFSLVIQQV